MRASAVDPGVTGAALASSSDDPCREQCAITGGLLLATSSCHTSSPAEPDRARPRREWIAERPALRPRTVELYRSLLRRHVTPWLGDVPLGRLDTPLVREWRARLLEEGVSATVTAKAYRLLRAVLMTAVNEDRLISRNPCQVRGADREVAGERPVLSVAEVLALADEVPARYRAMILLTIFASPSLR